MTPLPILAFILSFVVPGAGLAYLGRWTWAIANLLLYLLIAGLCAAFLPQDIFVQYVRTISMTCSAASAIFAHIVAVRQKREILRERADEAADGDTSEHLRTEQWTADEQNRWPNDARP